MIISTISRFRPPAIDTDYRQPGIRGLLPRNSAESIARVPSLNAPIPFAHTDFIDLMQEHLVPPYKRLIASAHPCFEYPTSGAKLPGHDSAVSCEPAKSPIFDPVFQR